MDIEDEVGIRAVVATRIVEINKCVLDRMGCHRIDHHNIPISFVGRTLI